MSENPKAFGQDSPAMLPDAGQTYSEFMDECISETGDADGCMLAWDERGGGRVVHKTHAAEVSNGMEFVLSDATPDRYGDVIAADGWDLTNFKKNPIALFNHRSDFPIGRWDGLRVVNGQLRGNLRMAPAGTSDRIDEIRKLIDADILRAVSVGFKPIESKPRTEKGASGEVFLKSELVETSLVSVPANPNALAIVKALKISAETRDLVFAKHGKTDEDVKRRGLNGEHARPPRTSKGPTMSPIAQRIDETQKRIVKLKDQLDTHLKNVDDENPTDDSTTITSDITGKIEAQERSLEALRRAESHIIESVRTEQQPVQQQQRQVTTFQGGGSSAVEVHNQRPFSVPAQKLTALDYLFRAATVQFKHHAMKGQKTMNDLMVESYGEDTTTKAVMDIVTRAASAPAMTTVSGWADTLVNKIIGDMIESLLPMSIFPRLAGMGGSYNFGRNGQITLPARTVGNLGGGFIAQGAPIPVKQGAFTPVVLTPKKLGVITTMTREMSEHSTPALEGILRQGILEDTGLAIDTILMDNTAATTTRPQGIQNLAGAALGPTAGGGVAALIGDLKLMIQDLLATTTGNLRKPVWIMNPGDVLVASLTQAAAGGSFPFADDLAQGRLLGYPVIQSTVGTTDTMYLIDAADFATAQGAPRFDISDSAVLHMEDTTPLQLASVATPNTVAAPMRSLYQTDSLAIRMIWDLDWVFKRQNTAAFVTTMSWN